MQCVYLLKSIMLREMVTQGQVFLLCLLKKLHFMDCYYCGVDCIIRVNRSWQDRLWYQEILWLLLTVHVM